MLTLISRASYHPFIPKGMCWASSRCIPNGHWKHLGDKEQVITYRQISRSKQWKKASSMKRWLVTLIWSVFKNRPLILGANQLTETLVVWPIIIGIVLMLTQWISV